MIYLPDATVSIIKTLVEHGSNARLSRIPLPLKQDVGVMATSPRLLECPPTVPRLSRQVPTTPASPVSTTSPIRCQYELKGTIHACLASRVSLLVSFQSNASGADIDGNRVIKLHTPSSILSPTADAFLFPRHRQKPCCSRSQCSHKKHRSIYPRARSYSVTKSCVELM